MKPLLIATCCALVGAPAAAQSSVTVSGILDAAARHVSNEGRGSISSLVSGSNNTSRLIFSGREDLGGGLTAAFWLEHGLSVDSGAVNEATKFWDRRSTVSLLGRQWGEVRLGRDFIPSYTSWTRFDPFSYVGVARSANVVTGGQTGPIGATFGSNPNTTVRSDNAVQYLSPAVAGFDVGLMVAAGEGGAVASGNAKLYAGRVGYASGPVNASAAYTTSENANTVAGKFKDATVGASYDIANVRLGAAWRQFKYGTAEQTMWMLSAVGTFGPHEVKGSFIKVDMDGRVGAANIGANGARQLGLGYVYNLSKRTALYTTAARIDNDGASTFTIAGGLAAWPAAARRPATKPASGTGSETPGVQPAAADRPCAAARAGRSIAAPNVRRTRPGAWCDPAPGAGGFNARSASRSSRPPAPCRPAGPAAVRPC
ncbi:porin [Aquabacterium sp. J223]|uniref:porin n=1 Tax=Aquabacterium sp. J223 TaxID=2898431 RepID=UPI0021AE0C77|nr:porin [Aquabacterium sp. J223]UUX97124.1 porin [Aquabacterium sp. J223]